MRKSWRSAPGPDETNDHGSPLIDLQGLQKVFDTNHDGVMDSQDARWNEFRVRHGLNQNCGVDESELRTMSEAGIKLIALIPSPAGAMALPPGFKLCRSLANQAHRTS